MGLFKNSKKVGVFSDVIRCDEPSYLIWKWHPDGTELGEHKREYSIRYGSSLRVKDGEVAVFVYKQGDKMQDFVEGPMDRKLKTLNLPVLSGLIGAFVGGDTPFQAEVYFINLAHVIQVRFAVPYFDVCDPRFPDFPVPVAVRGTMSFRIADYREFIKLHRLNGFDLNAFEEQLRDAVSRYVRNTVASAPVEHKIALTQMEAKSGMINDLVETALKQRLKEDFGVLVSGFDIGVIEIDKTSEGYSHLVAVTRNVTRERVEAQTGIEIENYAETLRIQREEAQYALHKQTQTANLPAYQVEMQTQVGLAGADALGQMGANGAGTISGGGLNPVSLLTGLALGGVVGRNIAGTVEGAMAGAMQPPSQQASAPKLVYFVAVNGQSTGPYETAVLKQMAVSGQFAKNSLVWRAGMSAWVKAGDLEELNGVFEGVVPPVPPSV